MERRRRVESLHRLGLYFLRLDLLKIDGVLIFHFSTHLKESRWATIVAKKFSPANRQADILMEHVR